MPDYTKLSFNNKISSSLQVGDAIYTANILTGGLISSPQFASKVIQVGANFLVLDKHPAADPIIEIGSNNYILFAKNININESSLKGYYADVTFENASNKKTELFTVSSEVVPSSK